MYDFLALSFLLLLLGGFAFVFGRSDERIAAATFVCTSLASVLIEARTGLIGHDGVAVSSVVVDVLALAGYMVVAVRSERFWPLWVAGLQLAMILTYGFAFRRIDLPPELNAEVSSFWLYPIALVIVIGTSRNARRRAVEGRAIG